MTKGKLGKFLDGLLSSLNYLILSENFYFSEKNKLASWVYTRDMLYWL